MAAAVVLAVLAACAHNEPLRPAAPVPEAKAERPTCYQELDQRGVTYERERDFHTAEGCGIDQNVRVDKSPIPLSRPAPMSCMFAVTLADFDMKIVQPAAKRIFKKKVVEIGHAGTYACRGERGGNPIRLSQHAYGKAIDILGFELEGGERITVLKDWRGDSDKAKFLHEVAKGACSLFDVVITPNRNSFHLDHIHLDRGKYKLCGI
jgi:hypothetical protein